MDFSANSAISASDGCDSNGIAIVEMTGVQHISPAVQLRSMKPMGAVARLVALPGSTNPLAGPTAGQPRPRYGTILGRSRSGPSGWRLGLDHRLGPGFGRGLVGMI